MNNSKIKLAVQIVIFALLGGAIMYFMWQSQGAAYSEECLISGIPANECSLFEKLLYDYKNAKISWLVVISICFLMSQVFRAVRWRILLKPLGYNVSLFNSFATLMVGYFANLGAPRIGEFVRAGLISNYEKVPIEKAFATIVIERVIDVIMLGVMILLGFIFHYDSLWGYISGNAPLSMTSVIIGLAVFVVLGIFGIWLINKIIHASEEGLHPILKKIKGMISGFWEAILQTKDIPDKIAFWAYSVGIWIMYYLMHYLAFFSFEPTSKLSPADGVLVFDFGALGVLFPSPGGMGSYHYMIKEALEIFGVSAVDGFSFAMISFFTLTIFCTVIFGLITLILLPIVNSSKKHG